MTETAPSTGDARKPSWWDRPRLLRGLLIASLALNMLVISAVATRIVRGHGIERMPGASQVQLLPRKFLRNLPDDKRKAAFDILKRYAQERKGSRQLMREVSLQLADAIAAEPYDTEKVKAVFADYERRSGEAASQSGAAALEVLALLSPEERAALAAGIRERAGPRR